MVGSSLTQSVSGNAKSDQIWILTRYENGTIHEPDIRPQQEPAERGAVATLIQAFQNLGHTRAAYAEKPGQFSPRADFAEVKKRLIVEG